MDNSPVVVGVDGGSDSLQALRWAAEYARSAEAPLIALTVFEMPVIYGPYAMAGFESPAALEENARSMLADAVRDTLGEDASVEQRVLRGHPAAALVDASMNAQLVVVGSRGRGGFAGLLMGSVSQHVISHAHSPVVVLPRLGET